MYLKELNTALLGNDKDWTFIGVPKWKQDHEGQIYPPVWSYPNFDPDPARPPNAYAHELAREDYAFLTSQPLSDTDVSVDYKCPYGSVIHGGIVFRSVDSSRFYALDVIDLGRKGHCYELSLWLQDETGYRKRLAHGKAPHSIVPESIVQRGTRTREEWNNSSPDWVTFRVQASGTYIRVSMDGQIVFELRDVTYPAGCVGLIGRGAVYFRNLRVKGAPAELTDPWKKHEGELPRFFYPGEEQPEGFNAYPAVCRTSDGITYVVWAHAPTLKDPKAKDVIVLSHSQDEGRTWSRPRTIQSSGERDCIPSSLFAHRDGSLSCFFRAMSEEGNSYVCTNLVIRSKDKGKSWSKPEEFRVGGRSLANYEGFYSPAQRLSDGTVVMCGYEARTIARGDVGTNADRLDRSLLFHSLDDGYSWEQPVFFDPENYDHNECMVAEVEPGKLVAFMRTLRAPYLWTSASVDGGKTWAPLTQSNISAECPILLRHSSGALILGSRGCGTFLNLSYDRGRSWTNQYRMSPASAMMGMVEMADGRILNVMHEGYRVPGYIRGQFFRVTPQGPVTSE